jgi:hypothetical protein
MSRRRRGSLCGAEPGRRERGHSDRWRATPAQRASQSRPWLAHADRLDQRHARFAAGDAKHGAFVALHCTACHGEDGISCVALTSRFGPARSIVRGECEIHL